MKTWQDKNSPLYNGLPYQSIEGNHITYPNVSEIKYNGEFQYLISNSTGNYLANKKEYGRIRTGMKCTNIALPEDSVFLAELIYEDGKVFEEFQRHKLTDDLRLAVFQVLRLKGQDIWKVANYSDQRKLLEKQKFYNKDIFLAQNFGIVNQSQLDTIFRILTNQGYEGIVIKDPLSPFVDGDTGWWAKKKFEDDNDLAIIGFQTANSRVKSLSLLLGHQINGQILPICHCGGGMKEGEKETFLRVLRPLVIDKRGDDYLVKPQIVIKVKHGGVIRDANGNVSSLRSPQFRDIRLDKTIQEVDTIK